jgi:hypothetical protein
MLDVMVITKIGRKENVLDTKWDSIKKKHARKNKGYNGMWIMDPKCMHVRNEIACVHNFLQPLSSNN